MKIFKHIASLQTELKILKDSFGSVGFVPTMGALHQGHLSLINHSKQQNSVTAVSIFVNPTQFNDKKDFEKYPRTLQSDLKILNDAGCDIVFTPDEKEMYPEPDLRVFDFGGLDEPMEGKCRPDHFNGVAQIVTRLFDIVKPDRAYFGYKDFQQLAIIKYVVKTHNIPVEIVPCPIIRGKNGLALSSRNTRLTNQERSIASNISQVLFYVRDNYNKFLSPENVKNYVFHQLTGIHHLNVEYFEIVDEKSLEPVNDLKSLVGKVGCIAVWVGKVRLIDNIKFLS